MLEKQQRTRTIQAYYSELALAEAFNEWATVNTDEEQERYLKKAKQHFRSAERLADYIAAQYREDLYNLPTLEEFLKA